MLDIVAIMNYAFSVYQITSTIADSIIVIVALMHIGIIDLY